MATTPRIANIKSEEIMQAMVRLPYTEGGSYCATDALPRWELCLSSAVDPAKEINAMPMIFRLPAILIAEM
jgi:hypothetical protein